MENQMSTGSSSLEVDHWAYIVQTTPGSASWQSYPGLNMSGTKFMMDCLDAAPAVAPQ
jgi:hypothetical protein